MNKQQDIVERTAFGANRAPEKPEPDIARRHLQDGKMTILHEGTEDEMEVWGYEKSVWRLMLTLAAILGTCGLLGLPLYWLQHLWLYFTHRPCDLDKATSVLVLHRYKGKHVTRFVKSVKKETDNNLYLPQAGQPTNSQVSQYRYFHVKKFKYYWNMEAKTFVVCNGLEAGFSLKQILEHEQGLDEGESKRRRTFYGQNDIQVPVDSIIKLMFKELLTPFYVFQVFSMILWFVDEYIYYASAILIISVISLSTALYNTRKTQANLRRTMVLHDLVRIHRPSGHVEEAMSSELVPGDVFEIPSHKAFLMCDALLLSGQVIVNESMLTGESVPVTKTCFNRLQLSATDGEREAYSERMHGKHTLRSGTQIIQSKLIANSAGDDVVKAVVLRTGFQTAKGGLVRSILYPPPADFKFETDSYKFIMVMGVIAMAGMLYTLAKMVIDEEPLEDILLEVLDLVTILVPPALPAAMTIGVVIAQRRLLKRRIFCISPRAINVAGSINCVCFDKTGTITEEGMDMFGLVATQLAVKTYLSNAIVDKEAESERPQFLPPLTGTQGVAQGSQHLSGWGPRSIGQIGMATCHELNKIEGEIMGDPLEVKIFEATGWTIEGPSDGKVDSLMMPYLQSPSSGGVQSEAPVIAANIRVFPFSSDQQCMSVVTRLSSEEAGGSFSPPVTFVFCKGSPEKLASICRSDTLPADFTNQLNQFASKGYRILALGAKPLVSTVAEADGDPAKIIKESQINKMTRGDIESELCFLGLIVLENRLKPTSRAVIDELHAANIRPIMVTGDNKLTGVCVAKDCGLVPLGKRIVHIDIDPLSEAGDARPRLKMWEEDEGKISANGAGNGQVNLQLTGSSWDDVVLAVEGPTFEAIQKYYPTDVLPHVTTKGAVFARMKPDMKQNLVEALSNLGYYVGMCGDGANDCGALKAAHAGISLSEAEASVASPFTSGTANISCVPALIREGRAALVTSFGIFKYMAGYSLTQFISVMILYEFYSNLADTQYLYIDLFLILSHASAFGLNKAYSGPLAKQPPNNSLIATLPLLSIIGQIIIISGFQLGTLFFTTSQDWYVEFDYTNACYYNTTAEVEYSSQDVSQLEKCSEEDDPVASYENYGIFTVSQFQYAILVVAFAKGYPYRTNIYSNWSMMAVLALLSAFSLYLSLKPSGVFVYAEVIGFEIFLPPEDHFNFRLYLLLFVVGNLALALVYELFLDSAVAPRLNIKQNTDYKRIENDWKGAGPASNPIQQILDSIGVKKVTPKDKPRFGHPNNSMVMEDQSSQKNEVIVVAYEAGHDLHQDFEHLANEHEK